MTIRVEEARAVIGEQQKVNERTQVPAKPEQEQSVHVTAKEEQEAKAKTANTEAKPAQAPEQKPKVKAPKKPKSLWGRFTDWLKDKDKVCTDGKEDGKIGFWQGAKSFAKGFFGGIIKDVINHPIITAAVIGVSKAALVLTGGAAAPLLWGIGAVGLVAALGFGAYKLATAEKDGETKSAFELLGKALSGSLLLGLTYKSTIDTAAKAGVQAAKDGRNIFAVMKDAVPQCGKNIKGNYLTWKTGVIHANSNATRSNVQVGLQEGEKVIVADKADLNGTVEEVLAKNPGLKYDATLKKFYVETSQNAPIRYKIVPEGTKYLDAQSAKPDVVDAGSVLRIDGQGRPYKSTVDFMLRKVKLTPEQIEGLKPGFQKQLAPIEAKHQLFCYLEDRYNPKGLVDGFDMDYFPKNLVDASKKAGMFFEPCKQN